MEVMLVVALLAILAAITVVSVSGLRKRLRMTELDSAAETLYMAAQNRITELEAAGRASEYQPGRTGVRALGYVPSHALYPDKYGSDTLSYITSDGNSNIIDLLLPEGSVDAELRGASWVVEYDPYSASIYGVFFSESEEPARYHSAAAESSRTAQLRRDRASRLRDGATVGFYGGDSVEAEPAVLLEPFMIVNNRERLEVVVTCENPGMLSLNEQLAVELVVQEIDAAGQPVAGRRNVLAGTAVWVPSLARYSCSIILDDLTSTALRFFRRCPNVTPGAYIELTATVSSENPSVVPSVTMPQHTNSIFGYDVTQDSVAAADTAVIRWGRHLQNLNIATSHVSFTGAPLITKAVQRADVLFQDTAMTDDWFDVYGNRPFTPIQNRYIESFTVETLPGAAEPVISGLTLVEGGGLFRTYAGSALTGVNMVDTEITGAGSVGALCGRSTNAALAISDCRVYLSSEKLAELGRAEKAASVRTLIRGSETGGLVGTAAAALRISDSFAATTLYGSSAAGGLVGGASAALTIERSYADCYAGGGSVGGLVGVARSAVAVQTAYAAGFVDAQSVGAGLVAVVGGGASFSRVYSAVSHLAPEQEGNTTRSYGIAPSGSAASAYYLLDVGLNGGVGTEYSYERMQAASFTSPTQLGSGFTFEDAANESYPYNLVQEMALDTYAYPRLAALPHYGDWFAKPEYGLVYFERYGTSIGVYGANLNSLRSSGAADSDSYGILYTEKPARDQVITIEYQTGDGDFATAVYSGADVTETFIYKGVNYYLLPLPEAAVQKSTYVGRYYRQINVGAGVWFFNPHFACTVARPAANGAAPQIPKTIQIRTARQLGCLSRYYDGAYSRLLHRNDGSLSTFSQTLDIRYPAGSTQTPIGVATDFVHGYNGGGHEIRGLSLIAAQYGTSVYAGLFGRNASMVRNVVLANDVAVANGAISGCSIGGSASSSSLQLSGSHLSGYFGALAGWNGADGTLSNCASAGYRIAGSTYIGTQLYLGGFVGYNSGIVRNSSAVTAAIKLETNNASAYIGGFVGYNAANIQDSYSLAAIDVYRHDSGTVNESGFAGYNASSISGCYCSASLIAAGNAVSWAFNAGADARSSYYLAGGAYEYVGTTAAYENTNGSAASAAAQTYDELAARGAASAAGASKYHANTAKESYPFPAVVTNAAGKRVHYGDWPQEAILYDCGMFYWEHEVSGYNNGYHISYLGYSSLTQAIEHRSTLCTAHDDNGVIAEYGYGYYYATSGAEPTANWGGNVQGVAPVNGDVTRASAYHATASEAFSRQMPQWTFVAFQTGEPADPTGKLYISSGRDASLTLLRGGEGGGTTEFRFSPFFANALSAEGSASTGSTANPYEIRSMQQLQYINWNRVSRNCNTAVSRDNYTNYPYLQYTTITGSGIQTKEAAEANRSRQYWKQTHDLGVLSGTSSFYPIAGTYETSTNSSYNAILYAWFGGSYDGQSYIIRNIGISSDLSNVGLFGSTAGAELKNIILYSTQGSLIERRTAADAAASAYAIGGLAGIVYDYRGSSITISNCAIAGYRIEDNSQSQQALGEANIGGLIGVANTSLTNCTAVTDIAVNCTHPEHGRWGSFIRVGGIAGACPGSATNCYSGGSVSVSDALRSEQVTSAVGFDSKTEVYIAGIGGSGFASNFWNFTAQTSLNEGNPHYYNCYTYMTFPAAGGNVRAVSMIGSVADRFRQGAYVRIQNCYYLESCAAFGYNGAGLDFSKDDMIVGRVNNHGSALYECSPRSYTAMSAEDFRAELNDDGDPATEPAYFFVTVLENESIPIPGKYSFNCGDAQLEAKDYPFPTVLKQGEINVHYGRWRKVGVFTDRAAAQLDLIAADAGTLELPLSYYNGGGVKDAAASAPTMVFEDGETTSPYVSAALSWPETDENGDYTLTLTGLRVGQTQLTISYDVYTVTMDINVTADIQVGVEPASVSLFAGNTQEGVALTARDRDGAVIPQILWSWQSSDVDITNVNTIDSATADPAAVSVDGLSAGVARITFTATATDALGAPLGYTDEESVFRPYSADAILSVAVEPIGVIGVSDYNIFNEVTLGESDEYDGVNVTYSAGAPRCQIQGSTELFFYGNENASLDTWTVEEISMARVTGETTEAPAALRDEDGDGIYHDEADTCLLQILDGTELDANGFEYIPMRFWGADNSNDYLLTFRLHHGETRAANLRITLVPAPCLVTFLDNEDEWLTEVEVPYGESVPPERVPAVPTPEGHTLSWDTDFSVVMSDLTVRAVFEPILYQVTLDAAGGVADPEAVSVPYNGTYGAQQTLPVPERAGYTFAGWYYDPGEDADELLVTDASTIQTNENHTLTARWTENSYTLAFDANHGAGDAIASVSAAYSQTLTLPANAFTHPGYDYAGWNTAADGSGTPYADGAQVSGLAAENGVTVTLYAARSARSYTVSFDLNYAESTPPASVSVAYDSAYSLPADPGRHNHRFLGWFTAAEGGTAVTAATPMTTADDHTLYAHWVRIYTVSFELNGAPGTAPASLPVEAGGSYTLPAAEPVWGNHRFLGWFSAAEGGAQITAGAPMTTASDHALFAHWAAVYTVRFSANNGTGEMGDQIFDTAAPQTLTANAFTRRLYRFTGWNTAANGSGTPYANGAGITTPLTTEPGAVVTLYAQWQQRRQITVYRQVASPVGGNEYVIMDADMHSIYLNGNAIDALTVSAAAVSALDADEQPIANALNITSATPSLWAWKTNDKIQRGSRYLRIGTFGNGYELRTGTNNQASTWSYDAGSKYLRSGSSYVYFADNNFYTNGDDSDATQLYFYEQITAYEGD